MQKMTVVRPNPRPFSTRALIRGPRVDFPGTPAIRILRLRVAPAGTMRTPLMTAPTPTPDLIVDGPPAVDVNDTFNQLPETIKRKLTGFLRQRDTWAAASRPRPPIQFPPGSSPKAVMGGCEFCPSLGGGCIVCQDWE
jgi:hypothetical protein